MTETLIERLDGKQVVSLMRKHKKTIRGLSFAMGITQKRIRQVREKGLTDHLAIRDWLQAITGEDPGPIPERYRGRFSERAVRRRASGVLTRPSSVDTFPRTPFSD